MREGDDLLARHPGDALPARHPRGREDPSFSISNLYEWPLACAIATTYLLVNRATPFVLVILAVRGSIFLDFQPLRMATRMREGDDLLARHPGTTN